MSNSGFVIGKKPIKDMSDEELQTANTSLSSELQAVGNTLNACIQQLQISTAQLNVIKYEIDRRANSIAIARIIPN